MRWMTVVGLLGLMSCNGGEDVSVGELSGCDPIDPSICALPWPSSYYLREDTSTATGLRVHFFEDSLPENIDNVQVRPNFLNEKDGFSTTSSMLLWFDDVSLDGTIGLKDLEDWDAPDVRTVIFDADTGERVPHFVELDMTAEDPSERLLMLRPLQSLKFATRYVVAVRGLEKNSGGPVDVSPAFARLRDQQEGSNPDVETRREHFEDHVFGPIAAHTDWDRSELQLAWDFTTVSRSNSLGKMDWIRDDVLDFVGTTGPEYTVDSVVEGDCAGGDAIARTVEGTFTVPLYTEEPAPPTFLTRDADGMPYRNGTTTAEYIVRIPCSIVESGQPGPLMHYGHGLLGDRYEARTGWLSQFADDYGYVVFAADWDGMSGEDAPQITLMLVDDVSNFSMIPERSFQGFAQFHALARMMKGDFANDPAVRFNDASGTSFSAIDPSRIGYYGNSQGAILGVAYLAQSKDISRGVLGVGGGPYEMLLTRSADFDPFFLVFKAKFSDHREISLLITMMQTLWDPAEGAGWLEDLANPPAGLPEKQVLKQVGIHDSQVTTLGAHFEARAIGAKLVAPATRPIFGLDEAAPGFTGSALVEFLYPDVPDEPLNNEPAADEYDTHECPRREPAGQQQIDDFLRTGVINHYCDGICDDSLQADRCG